MSLRSSITPFLRLAGYALFATSIFAFAFSADAGAKEPDVQESFSMEFVRVPLDHQGPQVIDLFLKLTYQTGMTQKDYPDFEIIHRDVLSFLSAYPNETDYIEVVNKKLSLEILSKYPVITGVAIDIKTYPTMTIPYSHTSHVSTSR